MAEREQKRALIWLNNTKGMGIRTIRKLLSEGKEPEQLYRDYARLKPKIAELCGAELADRLDVNRDDGLINGILTDMKTNGVDLVTIVDDTYPDTIKEIADAPPVLYTKGDKSLLKTFSVGVVGSREVSRYGREVTAMFAEALVSAGVTVVSGLARGVDGIAHQIALDHGGRTIAVLGCGIDVCYPAEHYSLYRNIAENGLIVSEYPLGTKPAGYQFPERNRIISGLSRGILITEAGEKSGSLITANCAIEQNRQLFVVPGNINSKYCKGSNQLLKQLQAAMVLDPNDMLEELHLPQLEEKQETEVQLDFFGGKVYEYLKAKDASFDELSTALDMKAADLNGILTELEMYGLIKTIKMNYYGV